MKTMITMQQNLKSLTINDKDKLLKQKKVTEVNINTAAEELKPLEAYTDEQGSGKYKGKNQWTWPINGTFPRYYHYWMLVNCLYYTIVVVPRISFEDRPRLSVLYLDMYFVVVYLVDMIRCFTEPFIEDSKLVINRK
jgi:hypothetical protein